MFSGKAKKPEFENTGTVLAEGISFEGGNIKGCGSVRIDGIVFGSVDIDGDLIIGEPGLIRGDVNSNFAKIYGKVEGNVKTSQSVHLAASANILGNLDCSSIIIDEGAIFCGTCQMSGGERVRGGKHRDKPADQPE
jgi:cytoskeletal protein CcmA (bactofilin family)